MLKSASAVAVVFLLAGCKGQSPTDNAATRYTDSLHASVTKAQDVTANMQKGAQEEEKALQGAQE